jgi:hypothetical protein
MVLPLTVFLPGRKVAQLAVIPVIREPHLRAYEEDLAIMHEYATVVYHILVHHWPACVRFFQTRNSMKGKTQIVHPDIADDVRDLVGGEDVREHLPWVQHRIAFTNSGHSSCYNALAALTLSSGEQGS